MDSVTLKERKIADFKYAFGTGRPESIDKDRSGESIGKGN